MVDFGEIYNTAVSIRGMKNISARLSNANDVKKIAAKPDAFYLSTMSRRIFRAGLKHAMVDKKWPHFEKVFHGFDIEAVRMMSNDELDALMQDRGLIRHWGKLSAVRTNAQAMHDVAQSHGSFATFIADWSGSEIVELWQFLVKNFNQLGGNSAPYFLRMCGKDTFLLTNDVLRALSFWEIYTGSGNSMRDRRFLQSCFNKWAEESGRSLCQVSQIMALSLEA